LRLRINEQFVGPDKLRDFGLVDGAVTRPQQSAFGEDAFPTIHEGITTDAAEGLMGVQDIAAVLKDWAQPFPTPDEWIDAEG
jgi:death-on-curing protein